MNAAFTVPIWGPFALIAIGVGAIYLEAFVPAGGLIGVLGTLSIVGAVVVAFTGVGPALGLVVLLIALIAAPATIIIAFSLFPRTRFGRKMILAEELQQDEPYAALVGTRGTALTVLRPSGTALVNGQKVSVVTDGEYIECGTVVEVVEVEGARILVRTADDGR